LQSRGAVDLGEARAALELRGIREANFIQNDQGTSQVAEPNVEADLEQLRQRMPIKAFERYQQLEGKIKLVRAEALRAGFAPNVNDGPRV
jgi:hypothetical protein